MGSPAPSSALADEVAKFAALADQWWDPAGPFRPLHKFNPARIRYVRDRLAAHFGREALSSQPFAGLNLIDIGCGGGLISEPMARLGFSVTGVDAAEENIGVARMHAERSGLPIAYECALVEDIVQRPKRYDVVLALEIVEHVADPQAFLKTAAELVAPGGALIAATLNRTLKSLALAKFGAEYVLRWVPAGTHDWRMFVRPSELTRGLRSGGLLVNDLTGMSYDLLTDSWRASKDLDINYLVMAQRK